MKRLRKIVANKRRHNNRILGSQSFGEPYDPYLLDELINYYSMQDTMNLSDIWDEIVDRYGDESLANDVIESIDDSDYIYSSESFEEPHDLDSLDELWEVIDDEDFDFRGVQDVGYDNDGNIMVVFNHGVSEDMIEPTAEDLLIAFRQYGYPVHQWDTNGTNVFILSRGSILGSVDTDDDDDFIKEIAQEFTSKNTSINTTKVPAIFRSVHNWTSGTINLDYGGGRADTATEYLSQYDVQNLIYDPYNRTKRHNSEVIRTIRKAGGADTATCSNVLNVIKEPEVRRNALINISKLVKPGGYVYFTTYEGSGKGDERPTGKESYQLNRRTDWYLDEIREVFPDAIRKGKLIIATNSRSVNSSTGITATSKLWMGKYKSAKDNKMHRVYFEFDTSDFEEAAQEFEDIVPEPYSYARLLGTAPDEALLQKDGFEKIEASDTSYIKNSDSTEGYVYTYCDECGKKNRVKVTFNNFNEPFNDTEFKCKYCGTSNLLTDPHSYDENGNVVEASHDEICKAISGDKSAIQSLKKQGYRVRKLVNPLQYAEVGTFEIVDPTTGKTYNYDNSVSYHSKTQDIEDGLGHNEITYL